MHRPCGLLALAVLLPAGCAGNKTPKGTTETAPPAVPSEPLATAEPIRPPVEMIRVSASVNDLDDMLVAVERSLGALAPGGRLDLHAIVRSLVRQQGFQPGFFDTLDLKGRSAAELAYPRKGEDARPDDFDLAAVLSITDGKKALETFPEDLAPQPIGDGLWRANRGEIAIHLRPEGKTLLVGKAPPDLDRAKGLVAGKPGPRLHVRAENLAVDDVDPTQVLELPGPVAGIVARVLKEATAAELVADVGTDRDFVISFSGEADLSNMGLDPFGAPKTAASAVAQKLPADPVFALSFSFGDPKLMHEQLDRWVARVPEPFNAWTADIVKAGHGTLDVVKGDVVLALYLDDKERATVVVAGDVANDDRARKRLRALWAATTALVEQYAALVGGKEGRFKATYKPDGLGFSAGKADQLSITAPKTFKAQTDRLAFLLGKKRPKLEIVETVNDGVAIVAIGAGARGVISDFGKGLKKPRERSLETDGLGFARTVAGGCQTCIVVDPRRALWAAAVFERDYEDDDGAAAAAKAARAAAETDSVVLSATLQPKGARAGIGLPKSLALAEPSQIGALIEIAKNWMAPPPKTESNTAEK